MMEMGNPLSELEMQKSAQKLKDRRKGESKSGSPTTGTHRGRATSLTKQRTFRFAHWCESCVEAKEQAGS